MSSCITQLRQLIQIWSLQKYLFKTLRDMDVFLRFPKYGKALCFPALREIIILQAVVEDFCGVRDPLKCYLFHQLWRDFIMTRSIICFCAFDLTLRQVVGDRKSCGVIEFTTAGSVRYRGL